MITSNFIARSSRLKVIPEITPDNRGFQMYNSGSTEVEVSEFLYALVRLIKPNYILETGTHYGISAAYMAQGLTDNALGHLATLEVIPELAAQARTLWADLGVSPRVHCIEQPSLKYTESRSIDLLFLDSEPDLRFDEFVRFWPLVRPGGFIGIHDLHPHLGYTGQVINGMANWPFGDFRQRLGQHIKSFDLQTFCFPTPRGFALFQKGDETFSHRKLLRGEI